MVKIIILILDLMNKKFKLNCLTKVQKIKVLQYLFKKIQF